MSERPSTEFMLLAAWQVQNPGSIASIVASMKFPTGFWPDIARRVLEWERQGLSEEQINTEIEAAKEHYTAHWSNLEASAPPRRPIPPATQARTDELMAELLGDPK